MAFYDRILFMWHYVRILCNYEVPFEPGSDGAGFDVDVDDWDDVNVDIVL